MYDVVIVGGPARHYQRHDLNVDRGRFDAWLRALLPGEVEVRHGTRLTGLRQERDAVAVELEVAGGREQVRGRLVVGADGAGSRVRGLAVPGAAPPARYLAIQEWFEASRPEPCYTAIFDPALTDFYGWAIPKAGRLVVGGALPGRHRAAAPPARLEGAQGAAPLRTAAAPAGHAERPAGHAGGGGAGGRAGGPRIMRFCLSISHSLSI